MSKKKKRNRGFFGNLMSLGNTAVAEEPIEESEGETSEDAAEDNNIPEGTLPENAALPNSPDLESAEMAGDPIHPRLHVTGDSQREIDPPEEETSRVDYMVKLAPEPPVKPAQPQSDASNIKVAQPTDAPTQEFVDELAASTAPEANINVVNEVVGVSVQQNASEVLPDFKNPDAATFKWFNDAVESCKQEARYAWLVDIIKGLDREFIEKNKLMIFSVLVLAALNMMSSNLEVKVPSEFEAEIRRIYGEPGLTYNDKHTAICTKFVQSLPEDIRQMGELYLSIVVDATKSVVI